MTQPATRRRDKLAPDPDVRRAIVTAASKSVREQGVRGLSVAAVLDRARVEHQGVLPPFRLQRRAGRHGLSGHGARRDAAAQEKDGRADTPVEAVAAWIDGRLDLAFDNNIKSDLRQLSMEAQSQMFASPELIQPAYAQMLEPLIEQLQRGLDEVHSTASIRERCPVDPRERCGRAPNGIGPQTIANEATSAEPRFSSACAVSAWRRTPSIDSLDTPDRGRPWTWVSPDRMP